MAKVKNYFGSHEIQRRREDFKVGSNFNFGMTFVVVFALVGTWSWYVGGKHWGMWLLASAILLFNSFITPALLSPFNVLWAKLGLLLYHLTSPIVLAFLFYMCFTPISLLLRLAGKDLLNLRLQPQTDSYWIVRNPPGPTPKSLNDQF